MATCTDLHACVCLWWICSSELLFVRSILTTIALLAIQALCYISTHFYKRKVPKTASYCIQIISTSYFACLCPLIFLCRFVGISYVAFCMCYLPPLHATSSYHRASVTSYHRVLFMAYMWAHCCVWLRRLNKHVRIYVLCVCGFVVLWFWWMPLRQNFLHSYVLASTLCVFDKTH